MKKYFLFISLDKDFYLGDIYIDNIRGEEQFSFAFSDEYLSGKDHIFLDPNLFLYKGRQFGLFGFLQDMCPDRFGRMLINKRQNDLALKKNETPKNLLLSDYLLLVNDKTRMGAFRLKKELDGEFLNNVEDAIPPYIYLRDIEYASRKLEEEGVITEEIYQKLFLPGSSLGGARPKANIYFNDEVYIAKFPSKNDSFDVEKYESIALAIAEKCGIDTPKFKLEKYSDQGSTLLVKRFDRENGKRKHYLTMMSVLGAKDGQSRDYSYLDMVDAVVAYCNNATKNLHELYRRLVFSYLLNNTDNHLRNHALLYGDGGYMLSPIYDINPTFYETDFALPLLNNKAPSKEAILADAHYYGLTYDDAKKIYEQIGKIILEELEKYSSKEISTLKTITKSRL